MIDGGGDGSGGEVRLRVEPESMALDTGVSELSERRDLIRRCVDSVYMSRGRRRAATVSQWAQRICAHRIGG